MCGSIEPPISSISSNFTALCRSGRMTISSQPCFAVPRMVESRSSSSAAPSRAKRRRRRRATLMLRVPSSTVESRFLNSRLSQTFTALCLRPSFWPMRTPSGLSPCAPKGDLPAVPIHLLPPSWRFFCSSSRFWRVSISLSQPIFSSSARSSSLRFISAKARSQSSGISVSDSSVGSIPLNTLANT